MNIANRLPLGAAAAAGVAKRRAFTKPTAAQMTLLFAELNDPTIDLAGIITTTPANNNLDANNQDLLRGIFRNLYRDNGRHGIHHSLVEIYLQFICEHVNSHHGVNAYMTLPICALKDTNFFVGYMRAQIGSRNTDAWTDDLDGNNLSADNFLQVRHIFLLDSSYPGHVALIVISPLARSVDYLDSSTARDGDKMGVVFNLLSSHLGEAFLPYEWRVRQGHGPVQGKASADCGIYAMTNAMFVAFGYEVDYGDKDMRVRRRIIANGLRNGPATVFYQPAAGVPISDAMQQYFYPLSEYWEQRGGDLAAVPTPVMPNRANGIARGFQPLNQRILDALPEAVRARRGRYEGVVTEAQMAAVCSSTPGHRGWENWDQDDLDEWIARAELRDERNRRRQDD